MRGQTWVFWRIPLPYQTERDGQWSLTIERVRTGGEFPPAPTDVRYFFLVVCAGGPKLVPLVSRRRHYTGDRLDPMVGLHYANGSVPRNANVRLHIESPTVALGQLAQDAGLYSPTTGADPVNGFRATLQAIAGKNGGVLPVHPIPSTVVLFDDGEHEDGAMEPDGIFNNPLKDVLRVEGTYQFRAVATYGDGCIASRETAWSVHVEPGIDPGHTRVTVVDVSAISGGSQGTFVIVPGDAYGNPIGPGRGDLFEVTPLPGVVVDGKVQDKGDGSYQVPIHWGTGVEPGVLVKQPDRDPVPVTPSGHVKPGGSNDCTPAANKLLDCLGLQDADARCVRVTSVNITIDLDERKCQKCGEQTAPAGKCRCGGKS